MTWWVISIWLINLDLRSKWIKMGKRWENTGNELEGRYCPLTLHSSLPPSPISRPHKEPVISQASLKFPPFCHENYSLGMWISGAHVSSWDRYVFREGIFFNCGFRYNFAFTETITLPYFMSFFSSVSGAI